MELMIARDDLREARTGLAEHCKILQQIKQAAAIKNAFDQNTEFRLAFRGNNFAVRGAPGHEALLIGGQRAYARCDAVRGDKDCVRPEERRDLRLVGLKLVVRARKRGVLAARRFQLDHAQRQAVDEDDDIRPAVDAALNHRELARRQPVVRGEIVEIDQADLVATDRAVIAIELDIDAFDHQLVQAAVLFNERRLLGGQHLP